MLFASLFAQLPYKNSQSNTQKASCPTFARLHIIHLPGIRIPTSGYIIPYRQCLSIDSCDEETSTRSYLGDFNHYFPSLYEFGFFSPVAYGLFLPFDKTAFRVWLSVSLSSSCHSPLQQKRKSRLPLSPPPSDVKEGLSPPASTACCAYLGTRLPSGPCYLPTSLHR